MFSNVFYIPYKNHYISKTVCNIYIPQYYLKDKMTFIFNDSFVSVVRK